MQAGIREGSLVNDHRLMWASVVIVVLLTSGWWHVSAIVGVTIFTTAAGVGWWLVRHRHWGWLRPATWIVTGWAAIAWVILLLVVLFISPSHTHYVR